MRFLATLLLTAAALSAQTAQSQLATPFTGNLTGTTGNAVFFDLTATSPVTLHGLDLHFADPMYTVGSVSVFRRIGPSATFETSTVGWTPVATVAITTAGPGTPTHCEFPALLRPTLPVGTTGVAVVANGLKHRYTTGAASYSSCQLTLTSNGAMNVPFTSTPVFRPRTVDANIYYTSEGPDICAAATPFGTGCNTCKASFYDFFPTPGSFTLAGSSISMMPTGSGYSVTPSAATMLPLTTSAVPLTLGDDTEVIVPLTAGTFRGCYGQRWSVMAICSNGRVSEAGGNSLAMPPAVPTLLGELFSAFSCQGDWDPSAGGAVWIDQGLTVITVTWSNVPSWNSLGSANTFQMQFFPNGMVNMVFGAMAPTGANGGILVGYSPGGPSADPGRTDLSVFTQIALCCDDEAPLTLSTNLRPVQPGVFDVTTSNIDTLDLVHVGVLGITNLGAAGWPMIGFGFGRGDCTLYCQPDAVQFAFLPGVTSWNWTALTLLPPGIDYRDIAFCVQAFTLRPPSPGPADRSSNALACLIGNQ